MNKTRIIILLLLLCCIVISLAWLLVELFKITNIEGSNQFLLVTSVTLILSPISFMTFFMTRYYFTNKIKQDF